MLSSEVGMNSYLRSFLLLFACMIPALAFGQAYEFLRPGGGVQSWGRDGFRPIDPKRENLLPNASNEIDLDLTNSKTTIEFDLQTLDPSNAKIDIGISEELYSVPVATQQPQVVVIGRAQPLFTPKSASLIRERIDMGGFA